MFKLPYKGIISGSYSIHIGLLGCLQGVLTIIQMEMPQDLVTHNAAAAACAEGLRWQLAAGLLRGLEREPLRLRLALLLLMIQTLHRSLKQHTTIIPRVATHKFMQDVCQ